MPADLTKAVRSIQNLEAAWRVIYQNGRSSTSESVKLELETFAEDPSSKLRSLQRQLARGIFKFQPSKGIPIPKLDARGRKTGKHRPIVLAPVESRIVQRAILNVLLKVDALKPYAETPFSFCGIRKTRAKDQSREESLSAVPAAIQAVLNAIESSGRFIVTADIQAFFTRISKDNVSDIVASAVNNASFMDLFTAAIRVELANLAELRNHANLFPIEDIGVAQGSSLSPLLGNIALARFDGSMNEGDCRCIRYIDDFIIIAPTLKAANARLKKAKNCNAPFE